MYHWEWHYGYWTDDAAFELCFSPSSTMHKNLVTLLNPLLLLLTLTGQIRDMHMRVLWTNVTNS